MAAPCCGRATEAELEDESRAAACALGLPADRIRAGRAKCPMSGTRSSCCNPGPRTSGGETDSRRQFRQAARLGTVMCAPPPAAGCPDGPSAGQASRLAFCA
jgi:hypothetical protein